MTDEKKDPVGEALAPISNRNLPVLSERFQPRNLTELMSWAKLVVASGLAPKGMNEAGVVICVQMGAEIGVSPAQAIQNIAVINGRPSIFGDLGLAIFKRDATYKAFEEDAPDVALKQGFGRCKIAMKNGDVIERRFSIEEAKAAKLWGKSGPWSDYPGRMLMWRARWWAMRDADGGVFKGISAAEEQWDVVHSEGAVDIQRPRARRDEASDGFESIDEFVQETSSRGGSGRPAPAAPPREGPNPHVGKIAEIKVREIKVRNKPSNLYTIFMEDGAQFTTFSDTVVQQAREIGRGVEVDISWEQKGKYTNATAVHPHLAEHSDAAEPEPEDQGGSSLFGDEAES